MATKTPRKGSAVAPPATHYSDAAVRRQARRRALDAVVVPGKRRLRPRHRLRVAISAIVFVVLFVLVGGNQIAVTLIDSTVGQLPTARALPADSLLYDRTGILLEDLHPNGSSRIPVALNQISPYVQQAIVAVEDRKFWSEGPVDVPRLIQSAVYDLKGSNLQGASTIPMQLAKALYLQDNLSLQYKIEEITLGSKLVSELSKPTILDEYLNDIFFGEGATGIQSAALVYFNKNASQLDLAQSAMLAGLPNAPSSLDPVIYPANAKARQLVVLQAMVRNLDITQAQEVAAYNEKLVLASNSVLNLNRVPAFDARVADQVATTLNVDPTTAGLTIHTTLLYALQLDAQQITDQQIAAIRDLNVTDGAVVSILPDSGQVVDYVSNAGANVPGAEFDMAATPRQPGSTFKTFTYPTLFSEREGTMLTPILDGPLCLPTGGGSNGESAWCPLDYSQSWAGILPLDQAFGNSLNIPAIRAELQAGIPNIVDFARKLGVTTLTQPDSSYTPSMTLGTYPVPLWEMAQADATYADGGVYHPATFVQSVDSNGKNVWPPPPPGVQMVDPGVAYIIDSILTNNNNRYLEFGVGPLVVPGHSVVAKTGTSENFKDNLTIGWTPHLLTATWVGNTNDSAMVGTTGVTGAAPIWHDVMVDGLGNGSDGWPKTPPSDIQAEYYNGQTGWFLDGTTPATGALGLTDNASSGYGFDYLTGTIEDPLFLSPGDTLPSGPLAATTPGGTPSTTGTTAVRYSGNCRYWTYNGGAYYWCGGGQSGFPGDPGPHP